MAKKVSNKQIAKPKAFHEREILCIGPVPWDGIWARPQQLMVRLAKRGQRIVYVNPPITWLSPIKDPALLKERVLGKRGLECVDDRIHVFHPGVQWPLGNMKRWVNRRNQKSMASQLKKALHELKLEAPYLWTYLPGSADLIKELPGISGLIYDCVDEHASFSGLIEPDVVRAMEKDLMAQSLVTFASARELLNRRKGQARHLYRIPNGAEVEHFLPVLTDPNLPVAEEIKGLKKPVVGFYGGIGDWIDLELVAEGARAYPNYTFALIGPMERDQTPIEGLSNVHLFGPKPYRELPSYVKAFDLCVMPFKVNDLTLNVNPVKMYEHLAAGKAVLSTDLPEVRPFADVVRVAASRGDFVAAIGDLVEKERAVIQPDDPIIQRRVRTARENSWDGRLLAMIQQIEKVEKTR